MISEFINKKLNNMKNNNPTTSKKKKNLCFKFVKPQHQQRKSENMPKTTRNNENPQIYKQFKQQGKSFTSQIGRAHV